MITGGFLDSEERQGLLTLVRRPSGRHGPARRAHAILLLDDDTVYQWHGLWREGGSARLKTFGWKGGQPRLNATEEAALAEALTKQLYTSTAAIIALVAERFGVSYSRSGMTKLLARLGFEYRKPKALPPAPDVATQCAFVKAYEALLNGLEAKDVVLFCDAVHPEYQTRPAHGWVRKGDLVAVPSTTGRQRLNLHAALNLETGGCHLVEADQVNAQTTKRLLSRLLSAYPEAETIHVILDNAKYHHAKEVKTWLEKHGQRLNFIFLPPYAPNLNAIERLWAIMHKTVTHNKFYQSFNLFVDAILSFLKETVPKKWHQIRDTVSDNFHIIKTQNYRVLA